MDAKRQTKADFWILFAEQVRVNQRPGEDGEAVGQAVPFEEKQASPACIPQPALNSFGSGTVERICDPANLNRAYERVLANKGAPGADGMTYFRFAECKSHLHRMDEWIRRKLRCLRLKQCKRRKPIADWLRKLGVPEWRAWILALSGKG